MGLIYMREGKVKGKKKEIINNSQKVYEKDHYIILKVKSGKKVGYIAYNTRKEWENGHTHLESFNMAKTIIDNVIKHKNPKTKNLYLLQSHMRLSDSEEYDKFITDIVESKNKNKCNYKNKNM